MLAKNTCQWIDHCFLCTIGHARSRLDKFVFDFTDFVKNFRSSFFLFKEFLVRHCLPNGEWAPVSFQPCVYPDVWDLMTTFYTQKTEAEKKVIIRIFLYYKTLLINRDKQHMFLCLIPRLIQISFMQHGSLNWLDYRFRSSVFLSHYSFSFRSSKTIDFVEIESQHSLRLFLVSTEWLGRSTVVEQKSILIYFWLFLSKSSHELLIMGTRTQ